MSAHGEGQRERSESSGRLIGWPRGIASGIGVVLISFVALVVVPNLILTELTGMDRSARVTIATSEFLVALVLLAWTLRRLQRRGSA